MSPTQASDVLRWPQDYDPEIVKAARQAMASAGGKAKQAQLTPAQRSEAGRQMALRRWGKRREGLAAEVARG